ncbi:septation protein A [Acuticoccus mangrovi]|uniref:Inner membrane-spanning protein YciB n=1 Tax=Acuticoccus mangrovi TaxID=2796142 RepID=A0A934MH23_9HYPH|nr:septation protein A [Acuticoccus mangrovi]MBJ3777208.1 septation protein A [Acuticoccus mangrovi]
MAARQQNSIAKLVLELGPLVTFFVVNARAEAWHFADYALFSGVAPKEVPIMAATAAFMLATVAALAVSLALYRRIPVMPLLSGVIVVVFGGLTLYLQDELFIKLKPTIVNLMFAAALLGGLFVFKRPLLGFVFDSVFQLDEEGWWKLSFRWGLFFLFLAGLNEAVWRSFSTDTWVTFKVFGTMPLTIAFAISQMPLLNRHQLKPTADG